VSLESLRAALPPPHQKHLDPAAPVPAKMMASKGVLPLPPRESVIVLCGLTFDVAPEVVTAARASLGKLPDKILAAAIDGGLPPAALGLLAPLSAARDPIAEKIAVNRDTPDEAIAELALVASEHVAEIISSDQQRCLRSQPIVRALRDNPSLLRSSRDRLFDFLVRAGAIHDDLPEYAEALARLTPTEMVEAAERIELPPELNALLEDTPEVEARAEAVTEALEREIDEEAVHARVPILKLIQGLAVAQKVALAVKGNKEARIILVRDRNRVVASAAIRNPRTTEQEIITSAQSRSVSDEVIRIIAASKELLRTYGVKVALVNNPKTPLPTAMRLLTLLRDADVRAVAKSRNVSSAVANQAKRLVAMKKS
jgi:hypothetical protein